MFHRSSRWSLTTVGVLCCLICALSGCDGANGTTRRLDAAVYTTDASTLDQGALDVPSPSRLDASREAAAVEAGGSDTALVPPDVVRSNSDSGAPADGGPSLPLVDSGHTDPARDGGAVADDARGVVSSDSGSVPSSIELVASLDKSGVSDDVADGVATVARGLVTLTWMSTATSTDLYVPSIFETETDCLRVSMWAILAGFPGTPEGSYLTNINSTANQCWRLVARTDSSQMQRVFRIVVTPSVSIGRLDGVVVSRGGGNLQVITAWGGTSFGSVAGQFFDSSGTAIGVSIPFCTNTNGSQCDWTYTAEQVPAGATRLEVTASSVDSEGDVGAKTTSFSVEM